MLKVLGALNESQARWYVAREALARGRGGLKAMFELTGMSRPTILKAFGNWSSGRNYLASVFVSLAGDGSDWKNPIQDCRQRWSGLWKRIPLVTR